MVALGQDLFYENGERLKRPNGLNPFCQREVLMPAQQEGQEGQDGQLRGKILSLSHPDFGPGVVIDTGVCLPGDGTPHHIDDPDEAGPLPFGLLDGSEGVRGLS